MSDREKYLSRSTRSLTQNIPLNRQTALWWRVAIAYAVIVTIL